jgi:transposase
MATPVQTCIEQESPSQPALFLAFALGKHTWKLGCTLGVAQQPRARTIPAGDVARGQQEIARATQRFDLPEDARVVSCDEAGREGCWLHRSVGAHWVEHLGIDSASLAVHRRQRRAKTERLAVRKRLTMLLRSIAGEKNVWSVVRVPSVDEEDRRQLHRALTTAKHDRTRVRNRMQGLLAGSGVQRSLQGEVDAQLEQVQQGDGAPLPSALRTRLKRAWQQVGLRTAPLQTLEAERRALWRHREDPAVAQVRQRFTRRGIGVQSAWLDVMACFAWRDVQTPKQVGALAGLTPTPYQRGQSRRALGIATAGHRPIRAMAIAIAWAWRRFQPASALAQGDARRCGVGRARLRKLGMVALARKLLMALWRCFKTGALPEGAVLQAEAPSGEARRPHGQSGGMSQTVARAGGDLAEQGWAVCWCARLVVEPGAPDEPCWRGGRSPPGFSKRLRAQTGWGAWRQALPTRRAGRLGREGPTRHEASSTHDVHRPQEGEAPSSVVSPSGIPRAGAEQGHTASAIVRDEYAGHRRRRQPQGE